MNSILDTIKKMLGISSSYTQFDVDIMISINAAFNTLMQLGVGPAEGFSIVDNTSTWSDFISDMSKLEMVKQYIYLKVKMVFDPPASGTAANSYESLIQELTWRLNVQVDPEDNVL